MQVIILLDTLSLRRNRHIVHTSLPSGDNKSIILLDARSQLALVPLEEVLNLGIQIRWVQATLLHLLRERVLKVEHDVRQVGDYLKALVSDNRNHFLLVLATLDSNGSIREHVFLVTAASALASASVALFAARATGTPSASATAGTVHGLLIIFFGLFLLFLLALTLVV